MKRFWNRKEETPEAADPKQRSAWRKTFRWLRNLLFWPIILLFLLYFILQLDFVQQWVQNRVEASLEKKLQAEVAIKKVRFPFFSEITLEGLYIQGLQQDTLLYSEYLQADINLNPYSLIVNGLVVNKIDLQHAAINLKRQVGEEQNNLQIYLERLFPDKQDRENGNTFQLDLREVHLQDIRFNKLDSVKGNLLSIELNEGILGFSEFNLPDKYIYLDYLRLDQPDVTIEDFEAFPLTEPDTTEVDYRPLVRELREDTVFLTVRIDNFELIDGDFQLDNYRKAPERIPIPDVIDYRHLDVSDININFRNFVFDENLNFEGQVKDFSCKESSGFVLENLTASDAVVTPRGVQLNDVLIKTQYSEIGDTLTFSFREYQDFTDFNNRVFIDGKLNNAKIALRDVIFFASGLKQNTFFRENQYESMQFGGRLSGRINGLRGNDLNIRLTDGSLFRGNFRSRNLAVKDEEYIEFKIDRLNTSVKTFEKLIPRLDLPSSFDRLGNLSFNGSFVGFFTNFVAYGFLDSELGQAEMDLNLNLTEGREKAIYTGGLTLTDFDLGGWLNNRDFGKMTIKSYIEDGRGLTGETVDAKLKADVLEFSFLDYTYQDAAFNGTLNKNLLDGSFVISDDNIDFTFNGKLNFKEKTNNYVFDASINRLALKELNIVKKDYVLSGQVDINLEQDSLSNITGNSIITNLEMIDVENNKKTISEIYGFSTIDSTTNRRELIIRSDILDGNIEGSFNIEQIPDLFLQYLKRNHPDAARRLGIKAKELPPEQFFEWDFNLKNTNGLQVLIAPKLGELEDVRFTGFYSNRNDSLRAELIVPSLVLDKLRFERIAMFLEAEKDEGKLDFSIEETILNDKERLEPIKVISLFYKDTGLFALNYNSTASSIFDQVNLEGSIVPYDSTQYEIHLDQSNLTLLKDLWLINNENSIRISKDSLVINNFKLVNKEQTIELKSTGKNGLDVLVNNAEFDLINSLIDFEPITFGGRYRFQGKIGNLFKMQNINLALESDTLLMNNDDWGAFNVNAFANDLKSPLITSIRLDKDTSQLRAEGIFNISGKEDQQASIEEQPRYFDYHLDIYGFPIALAEYFIGNTISDTKGSFGASLKLTGLVNKPNIEGEVVLRNGEVTVNYLKTRYFFDKAVAVVDNRLFDLTETIIKDELGNSAILSKGIRHDHLRDFGFDAELQTPKLLALNTGKEDNKLFYGQAFGSGLIQFSGSFARPNIYINASVGDNTKIIIPLDRGETAGELDFIKFVDKSKIVVEPDANQAELPKIPKGVKLEMDLDILEEAAVELIFDEQAGDIIQGSGRGNLQIIVPRTGDFEMFGNYVIEQGDYLFTLYNLVNKKFEVRRGGTISWTGDPFGARIDLEATYSNVNASVAPFIQEYLVNEREEVQSDAKRTTKVDLKMFLQGELMQPQITFDIDLPELVGRIDNYANNKIDLLKRDQNELYKQVFGLIALGQFLPTEYDFKGAGNEIIYNTLSEFVSNQLSLLITELFSEFIGDGSALSGIDFDIRYDRSRTASVDGRDVNLGEELEIRLRQDFFNDRLSVVVGGNIDIGGNLSAQPRGANGTFFGNDLIIEYVLNRNRSLKLKLYQRLEPDIGGGRRLQIGTGISFRKEFNSFGEFLRSFRKDVKK